ncbi:MAG: HAMP domain-containing sensor histidine kinase [Bacteroidota bacterium]
MSKSLEQKNTGYLLRWLPLVFLLGSLLFLVMLTLHARHMQDNLLKLKQQNVWNAFIAGKGSMTMQIPGEYELAEKPGIFETRSGYTGDTSFQYVEDGAPNAETINFKTLTRYYNLHGKIFTLTTYVSLKEFFHLTVKVFATEALVFLALMLAIVIINKKSSLWLWRPFYFTLQKTGEFNLEKNQSLQLPGQTGIKEFDQLNAGLNNLIEKVNRAYSNQKNFVENASHEIQTPLAIIRSQLELLINEPGLTEKSAALLSDISEANERLSQLNKSLLLLVKIDNNQFPEQDMVNVSELIEKILHYYQEHYTDFPALSASVSPGIYRAANAALIEILFSNLIKNAVVHNSPEGFIKVHLDSNGFTIENSGAAIDGDPMFLFERFKKGNDGSSSTGLGLALVKQISQLYMMRLAYEYENGKHRIILGF